MVDIGQKIMRRYHHVSNRADDNMITFGSFTFRNRYAFLSNKLSNRFCNVSPTDILDFYDTEVG
jgi:hypothetical protein